MKLLAAVQQFRQGWGGVPESVRLLARVLAPAGVSVDVYDRGRLHRAVERLELLPGPATPGEAFDGATLRGYDAILIAGPWQHPRHLRPILKGREGSQPLIYLPRGGLAHIEFARARDLRKWPYLYLFERRIIDACSAMVFSSECEQRHTVRPARNRTREVVIPDLFEVDRPLLDVMEPAAVETRFGFMAEIAPRKGLVPLIRGFVEFASALGPKDRLRLTVGGSVRRGAEAYFAEARALAAKAPEYAPIEFIGAVSHADRSAFYCATDIFLVPSHFESFGLTVLEGLTAGCAEVVGPHVGVLEFLPADSGLEIARKVSPAAIATALRAQFERVQGQRRSDRTAAASGACEAIAKMNSLATDRWLALLAS